MPLVSFFRFSEVLFYNSLLLHTLTPLFLFSILVPEAVKEDVFNLASRVVFSDNVQILLGFVTRHSFHIVYWKHLNYCLECSNIFLVIETVVEWPADDREDNSLDPKEGAKIYTIFHEPQKWAIRPDQTMSRGKRSGAISSTLTAFQKAIKHHNTGSHCNNETDNTYIADHTSNDWHIVLGQVQSVMFVTPRAKDFPGLDNLRCETITVHCVIGAGARIDKLWTDSK